MVAARLAERCMIQVAYAIGVTHPVSMITETFETGAVGSSVLSSLIEE